MKKFDYFLPLSIIAAAVLIAGSLIYTTGLKNTASDIKNKEKQLAQVVPGIENIKQDIGEDHLRGNSEARVKIIEFSDMECPFCKMFHQTMMRVMEEYGKDGRVAWIYRHFPIEQLHSKAKQSAQASECAYELGGNEAFWRYLDRYFEITPSNNQIDLSQLPKIAEETGLNRSQFEDCLQSGRHQEKIKIQIQDAIDSGARGTPYSVVINQGGKKYPISGALPYEQVKLIIEEALK